MTTRQVLVAARAMIAQPEHWCQGYFHNRKGQRCAMGAILDAPAGPNGYLRALALVNDLVGEEGVVRFNDSHTHAEVLELYDRAIKAAA